MILGSKLRKSPNKASIQNQSFSYPSREKAHLKNSDLIRYIDSYLIKSKQQVLPFLDKKLQNALPIKLSSKPVHTLYAPCRIPNKAEEFLQKVLTRTKKKTPVFNDLKRRVHKDRRKAEVTKSLDDQALMCIKRIAESRPKSVLNNKVSCLMQTDDLIF